jgi:selenocysteine lyase/cysteine desulfurase
VDAIQSAGVKPSRTDDVDFWAAGTQKWLVSGLGLALLVVGDRALDAFDGPWPTYLGLRDPRRHDSGRAPSARRWELGWVTPTAVARFEASLGTLRGIGWRAVSEGIRERRDQVHEGLLEMGWRVVSPPDAWSGIVSIDPGDRSATSIVEDGYRRRIVTADRAGLVRISPHLFTSRREIDRALDWLWAIRSGRIAVEPAAALTLAATGPTAGLPIRRRAA